MRVHLTSEFPQIRCFSTGWIVVWLKTAMLHVVGCPLYRESRLLGVVVGICNVVGCLGSSRGADCGP